MSDENYNPNDKEDIPLEVDEEEDTNTNLRRTHQIRVPNPKYQHLQTKKWIKDNNSVDTCKIIGTIMYHFTLTTRCKINEKGNNF